MMAAATRRNAFNVAIAEHYATPAWPNATHPAQKRVVGLE
jgi:hypothetical protein